MISFEPSPDTAQLMECSASKLLDNARLINSKSSSSTNNNVGTIFRHPDSPGMTSFGGINSSFPFEALSSNLNINNNNKKKKKNMSSSNVKVDSIRILRAEDVLVEYGLPEGRSDALILLKVDVEGFEMQAIRGVYLYRFPFQFLTFELFREVIEAAGEDPVDLLFYVKDAGYKCSYGR